MLRPLRLKELCDGRTIGEIQFTVCARNDVGKAGPLQGAENCAADETAMTRHIDFVVDTHCETRLRVDLNSDRSEEHTSELQSLMRISYAVFCLKKKNYTKQNTKNKITIIIYR